MNNLSLIKDLIYLLINKSEKEAIDYLKSNNSLSSDEKNLIYFYLFPRPLLDKELSSRIMKYRGDSNLSGYLTPNLIETGLIMEAFRTKQYERYIKHLIYSFTNSNKVFPLLGDDKCECGLCGKTIYKKDLWDKLVNEHNSIDEKNNREYLAFGSEDSNITLCLDCLVQLNNASAYLEFIDPYYLDWRRKLLK